MFKYQNKCLLILLLSKPMTRRKHKGKKSQLTSRKKKTVSSKRTEVEEEAYRKLRVALQNVYAINKEQPTVKCIGCDTYFYSEEGMQTHFQHAHTNVKEIAVGGNNESKEDATLKDDSAEETQKDCSQNNERVTVSILENTDETELPDIVPPSQSVTRGRKCTRNECESLKTTWPKIFQIKRAKLEKGNKLKNKMMTKKKTTAKMITEF